VEAEREPGHNVGVGDRAIGGAPFWQTVAGHAERGATSPVEQPPMARVDGRWNDLLRLARTWLTRGAVRALGFRAARATVTVPTEGATRALVVMAVDPIVFDESCGMLYRARKPWWKLW
jgi:hypothetical protein